MKTIKCPYCQTKLNLPREAAGQEVDCPECSRPFLVSRDGEPIATVGKEKEKRHFFSSVFMAIGLAFSVLARNVLSFIHGNQIFMAAVMVFLSVLVYCWYNRYETFRNGNTALVIDHLTGDCYTVYGKFLTKP